MINPEGCTTNNEKLIDFKRGAFESLLGVQPCGLKYYSPIGISPMNDPVYTWNTIFLCSLSPYFTAHLKVYPTFKPNQYFWDNHWSESSGEQKWEAYARVIREHVIAKSFNFELSEVNVNDKLLFKDIMKGKKPASSAKLE